MLLLVGLGNPGPTYANNRHNIGFMAVDEIARRHGVGPFRRRFNGLAADSVIHGRQVLLLKPMTYMNRSGESVAGAVRFYKLEPADVVVFHDDIDLAPGRLRVKTGGGHGGHNGLRSIDSHIGRDYRRVRLGIGHPGDKDRVHAYVLHDFYRVDRIWIDPLLDAVAEAVPYLVAGDDNRFMNKVVTLTAPAKPKPEGKALSGGETGSGGTGE